MRRVHHRVGAFSFLACLVLASGCASEPAEADAPRSGEGATPSEWELVRFEPATAATDAVVAHLLAEMALPPSARAILAPPVAGQLTGWKVVAGARVEPGEPLATVLSPEVAELEARLGELERVRTARKRALEQRRGAVKAGVESRTTTVSDELSLAETEAELQMLRAQLDSRIALGAEGGRAWTWRSPVRGVVSTIHCAAGGVYSPDEHCLEIVDTAAAELRVYVPQRLCDLAREGGRLWWRSDAGSGGEEEGEKVEFQWKRCDPELDPRSRTLACYYAPTSAAGTSLAVGVVGRAELVADAAPHWLRVPRRAVTRLGDAQVLFVNAPGASPRDARPIPVQVRGQVEADWLVEASEGLAPGILVATQGVLVLKSHMLFGGAEVSGFAVPAPAEAAP